MVRLGRTSRRQQKNHGSSSKRVPVESFSSNSSSYSSGSYTVETRTDRDTRTISSGAFYDKDETDLFAEAEDMIKSNIQSLFSAATNCGLIRNLDQVNDRGDEGVNMDWRKPPYQSMSDWTLLVRDASIMANTAEGTAHTPQPKAYHLHKAVLSYGERQSLFFVKIFQEAHQSTKNDRRDAVISSSRVRSNKTTEVALPSRAAKFIPMLLDFIYFDSLEEMSADKAPALRYLANYFDVRLLFSLVSSFIQKDLSPSTVVIYLNEAELIKDKELVQLGVTMAISNFNSLSKKELELIPPQVFSQIVSNPDLECSSERLSERICYYMRGRLKRFGTPANAMVNDEVFYFLTHAQILPNLSSRAALWYLLFASMEFPTVLVDESMGGYEGSLKRRCIVAICQDWKDNLLGPIKASRRAAIKTGRGGNVNDSRLFEENGEDSDNEEDSERNRGYAKLPMSIRMEILEEALLNAAATPTPTATGSSGSGSASLEDNHHHLEQDEESEGGEYDDERHRHDTVTENLVKHLRSSSRSPTNMKGNRSSRLVV